ncbi:MAG: ATP-binding protein [Christensenellaceae bacterium]
MGAAQEELGISTDFRLALPANPGVESVDLCVILGNLLENALNACAAQTKGKKFIRTLAKVEGMEILICVENSYDSTIEYSNHEGLGIPSVNTIAGKYGGVASFERKDKQFCASVLLYKTE